MSTLDSCAEVAEFYRKHRPTGDGRPLFGRLVYGEGERWFHTYEPGDGSGWEIADGPFATQEAAQAASRKELIDDGIICPHCGGEL